MKKLEKASLTIMLVFVAFMLGIAVGGRLAFEGVLPLPSQFYTEPNNEVYKVEIIMDNTDTYTFYSE